MADFRYLIKRRQAWYVRVAVPPALIAVAGKQHVVRTLGTRDINEARSRRWTAIAEIHNHFTSLRGSTFQGFPQGDQKAARGEVGNIPLKVLLSVWTSEVAGKIAGQTINQHLAIINQFINAGQVQVLYATDIDRRKAGEFVSNDLLKNNLFAIRTVNRKISSLSTFWKWLIRRGHAESNPWSLQGDYKAGNTTKTKKERPYTPSELIKLLQGFNHHRQGPYGDALKDLIPLALMTGCRLNELCELKPEHVNHSNKTITIVEGKTSAASREIPVHPLLWTMVSKRAQGPAWLFPGLTPGGPDQKRSWNASKRFTDYRRKVLGTSTDGELDFHSLRRSFMTYMERGKLLSPNIITDSLIAELVGHTKTTMAGAVYSAGFLPKHRREAINHLSQLLEPEVIQALSTRC